MFTPSIGIGELVLRTIIVYVFLFALIRLVGKKHVGDLAPLDLIVLLILSECVQNALIADDRSSITGGLLAAGTLFGASQLIGYVSWRSKRAERMLEGTPRVLVRNGKVCDGVPAQEQITRSELLEALRKAGCTSLARVQYAALENDGGISIGLRAERSA